MAEDRITTVGELRAELEGVPDDMLVRGAAEAGCVVSDGVSAGVSEYDQWTGRKNKRSTAFWISID